MADQAGNIEIEESEPHGEVRPHPNPLPAGEGVLDAASARRERSGLLGLVADYIALTKPPIISLLLVTAIGGMFLAARGVPDLMTLLLVCVGGALGAGGANAINHYLDQDIDALMARTAQRPVPGNRVRPFMALSFGIALNIAAFGVLFYWVNWLAATLTLAASLFYVLVYTGWLKRSTPQNIVIGGAAGSIPPAVGWVAVTGSFDLPALYMFAIVFFWTPPHFWALSLLIQRDYERAGVPMLPVVAGEQKTVENIFAYSLVLVALTLVFAATGAVGGVYLGAAAALGAVFIWAAWRLFRAQTRQKARNLYLYSLLYLALLFGAMMADGVYRVL
ncbi:MAG: protoheme IX farnesyltransferase [Chloroflexi bacterium]|nr:protoheme IX farnesyltransferase [Chloroflexota bacterium]MYE39882.1 protoheme IX farnesyltransferase [Chloroflexota bacterium]